jgi:phosphate:Na+ symporter
MERLRKRTVESIETSEIHLDAVRDLVQINTLVTSVAYPILEETGELLDSRLASARP